MKKVKTKSLSDFAEQQQLSSGYSDFKTMSVSLTKNPRLMKVADLLKNHFPKGKLLDIGCGDGSFSFYLKKLGYDVYGLELDSRLVGSANKAGLKVTIGSFLNKFPFKSAYFNVLFAGEVMEHTVDDDFFLKECHRVLRKEGLLILTTPNLVSLTNRIRMSLGHLPKYAYQPYHYRIYNLNLITHKLKGAGFKIKFYTASHILISRYLNRWYSKIFGPLGELLGTLFPNLGEQFIFLAKK